MPGPAGPRCHTPSNIYVISPRTPRQVLSPSPGDVSGRLSAFEALVSGNSHDSPPRGRPPGAAPLPWCRTTVHAAAPGHRRKGSVNTPAGWYADPLGGHEHRYWDGERWTQHVATAGRTVTGPVGGTAAPPPPPTTAPPRPGSPAPQAETNAKAVASLAIGLLAGWIPFVAAIIAIVLGVVARREIAASGGKQHGDGLALAGILVGAVGVLLWLLIAAVFVFVFVLGAPLLLEFEHQFERELERELERRLEDQILEPRALALGLTVGVGRLIDRW